MNESTQKRKKILYVITKSNWGGAQRYVFDLATAMKESGYDVAVALGGEGVLKQKLDSADIRTISIASLARDMSVTKDTASLFTLYNIIKRERPDILHLNSPKAAGLGAFAGLLLGIKKIIYTVHGWTFNEGRPFVERAVIVFFSWLTMLFSHRTILLSQREFNQASRFPFIKGTLVLIPLGLQRPAFLPSDEARKQISTRINFDISKGFVIGTIAELHPVKGLKYFIEAMADIVKKHQKTLGVIVSDGKERMVLEGLIKEKGLEKSMFLTGYIENAAHYLKAFDVFVLPSIKEGLPYVLLEAGLASLPVIATNVGGVPEIIERKRSGILIQSKNPRELSDAISFLIEHREKRDAYGAALKANTGTRFSFEQMLNRTEGLYASPERKVA